MNAQDLSIALTVAALRGDNDAYRTLAFDHTAPRAARAALEALWRVTQALGELQGPEFVEETIGGMQDVALENAANQ